MERSTLLDLVEEFRLGLIARSTGGFMEPERYKEIRKTLLEAPSITSDVPRFVRLCRTPDDFWAWIKGESSTYAERRSFISTSFQPILEKLEGLENIAETELVFGEFWGAEALVPCTRCAIKS